MELGLSTERTATKPRAPQGFAAIRPELQRQIASKGGRAAHRKGTAHEWDSAQAREAGRLGGLKTAERRRLQRLAEKGGEA